MLCPKYLFCRAYQDYSLRNIANKIHTILRFCFKKNILEVEVLEGKMCLDDSCSFYSRSKYILLRGNVTGLWNAVQRIQIAENIEEKLAYKYFVKMLGSGNSTR